jgi:hypothetical protein
MTEPYDRNGRPVIVKLDETDNHKTTGAVLIAHGAAAAGSASRLQPHLSHPLHGDLDTQRSHHVEVAEEKTLSPVDF